MRAYHCNALLILFPYRLRVVTMKYRYWRVPVVLCALLVFTSLASSKKKDAAETVNKELPAG